MLASVKLYLHKKYELILKFNKLYDKNNKKQYILLVINLKLILFTYFYFQNTIM